MDIEIDFNFQLSDTPNNFLFEFDLYLVKVISLWKKNSVIWTMADAKMKIKIKIQYKMWSSDQKNSHQKVSY